MAAEMIPVTSSNIEAVGYDPEKQELVVRFTSGAEYAYDGVDPTAYSDFLASGSKGKHFAAYIKSRFSARRIR